MYKIKEDIKTGKLEKLYLLYGEEEYLVSLYKSKLLHAFTGSGSKRELESNMNFRAYNGENPDVRDIISFADTMPFFADRRVILIENSSLFQSGCDELADYIKSMPDTACFIFAEKKVDKKTRMYKEAEKCGHVSEFKKMREQDMEAWIISMVRNANINITRGAMDILLHRVSDDMTTMKNEMDKLLSYTYGKEVIEAEDVLAICSLKINEQIFKMIDACADGNRQRALELYYELLAFREPPMKILSLLGKQFSQLLVIKDLRNKGYDKKRIVEKTGIRDFVVDKAMKQSARFPSAVLKNAVKDCALNDEAVKSGKMTDILCVELFLIKYSSKIAETK